MKRLFALLIAGLVCSGALAETIEPHTGVEADGALCDRTVHVSFELSDVTDTDIRVRVYDYLQYEAEDVSGLQVGDCVVTDTAEIEVRALETYDDVVYINQEDEDRVCLFRPEDSGCYYLMGEEYPKTVFVREAQPALKDEVALTYVTYDEDGDERYEERTVSAAELKGALTEIYDRLYYGFDPDLTELRLEGELVAGIDLDQ